MVKQLNIDMNDFRLPIVIPKDCDYYCKLRQTFRAYCNFIKKVQQKNNIENLFNKVYENCSRIVKCLESYYNAEHSQAQALIKEYLKQYGEDNPYIITSIEESYAFRGSAPKALQPEIYKDDQEARKEYDKMMDIPLTFFRARTSKDSLGLKDMLHIPFDMRGKIETQRFSIPGVPCLYLATTSYGTWIELNRPAYEEFYVSLFKLPKDLKVLNLCIFQHYINGLSFAADEREYNEVIKFLEFFPLVIATSFRILEEDRKFKSEYIISQLVMQSARKLEIDGVAYLSKREPDDFTYPVAVNLAILIPQNFVEKSKNNLYWKRISEIQLTEPIKFSEFCNLDISKSPLPPNCRSYVNECFAKDGDCEVSIKNGKYKYRDTDFAKYDEYLVGQKLKIYEDKQNYNV